jgi:hypothetical protein
MNDGFSWWLVVLGIAVGIGLVWLFTIRLPVSESDIDEGELVDEAGWISDTIESQGGVAPSVLVQEVLELHRHYLSGDRAAPDSTELPEVPQPNEAANVPLAPPGTPEPPAVPPAREVPPDHDRYARPQPPERPAPEA